MEKEIILWAESQAEAEEFISLLNHDEHFLISNIYVAKRSRGNRDVGHRYINGTYFPYDKQLEAVINDDIIAPDFIIDLVQWCSPDIILSTKYDALISIETTYHELTYNNVAQRIPRQIRSAAVGVPSIIFQKLPAKYSKLNYVSWFVKTFLKATSIYRIPCLALTFTEINFEDARKKLIDLLNSLIDDEKIFNSHANDVIMNMEQLASFYDEQNLINGSRNKGRTWLKVSDDSVQVIIGVKDNCALQGTPEYGCQGNIKQQNLFRKSLRARELGEVGCVWLSKGTGGLDPYPGLVKMAEILLCYDEFGNKDKAINAHFSRLPEHFWWFQRNRNEIYFRLINEFCDEVTYTEDYN